MIQKHFAFILNVPAKGKFLLWPDYYENAQSEIDEGFKEVQYDVTKKIGFYAALKPYKVFVKKTKQEKV